MTPRPLILAAVALYRREPACVNGMVATLLGPLLVRVGLGVDDATTLALVGAGLNFVVAAATRRLVVPTAKAHEIALAAAGALPIDRDTHPAFAEYRVALAAHVAGATWQPANPDVNAVKEPVEHGGSITQMHDTVRRTKRKA